MAIGWCQVCGSSVWSGQPCGKCAHDGIVAARDAEIVRLKAEHDQALAACAEMRAALESIRYDVTENVVIPGAHKALLAGVDEKCRALLSRPDLGTGMVVVPREMVERVRISVDMLLGHRAHRTSCARCDPAREAVADLDALLKKGGG